MRHKKNSTRRLASRLLLAMAVFFCVTLAIGTLIGFNIGKGYASTIETPDVVTVPIVEETTTSSLVVVTDDEAVETDVPEEVEVEYYDCPLSHDVQDYIRNLCEENNVPMSLVLAMIEVESSFRPDVVSGTDDYGLMQINSFNHEWLSEKYGVTNFLDPYQNVLCGINIIAEHLEATDGNVALALMRYNYGATGASKLWEQGIYSTQHSEKILAAMEGYVDEI